MCLTCRSTIRAGFFCSSLEFGQKGIHRRIATCQGHESGRDPLMTKSCVTKSCRGIQICLIPPLLRFSFRKGGTLIAANDYIPYTCALHTTRRENGLLCDACSDPRSSIRLPGSGYLARWRALQEIRARAVNPLLPSLQRLWTCELLDD